MYFRRLPIAVRFLLSVETCLITAPVSPLTRERIIASGSFRLVRAYEKKQRPAAAMSKAYSPKDMRQAIRLGEYKIFWILYDRCGPWDNQPLIRLRKWIWKPLVESGRVSWLRDYKRVDKNFPSQNLPEDHRALMIPALLAADAKMIEYLVSIGLCIRSDATRLMLEKLNKRARKGKIQSARVELKHVCAMLPPILRFVGRRYRYRISEQVISDMITESRAHIIDDVQMLNADEDAAEPDDDEDE